MRESAVANHRRAQYNPECDIAFIEQLYKPKLILSGILDTTFCWALLHEWKIDPKEAMFVI